MSKCGMFVCSIILFKLTGPSVVEVKQNHDGKNVKYLVDVADPTIIM